MVFDVLLAEDVELDVSLYLEVRVGEKGVGVNGIYRDPMEETEDDDESDVENKVVIDQVRTVNDEVEEDIDNIHLMTMPKMRMK